VYEWEWLDEIVHGMHDVGVTPWITLVFNNPLYPQHCHPQCDNSSDYTSAAAPLPDMTNTTVRNAWVAWVHALADRYAGTVNEFEVRLVLRLRAANVVCVRACARRHFPSCS
jgi:hypothetical protein